MPCWICNPYCGNCKPPMERPVMCPQCKTYNIITSAGQERICRKCGANLPDREEPPVVFCSYCGLECANPCNRHKLIPKDGVLMKCPWITPPKKSTKVTD